MRRYSTQRGSPKLSCIRVNLAFLSRIRLLILSHSRNAATKYLEMRLSSTRTILISLIALCGTSLALPSPLDNAIDNSQSTNLNAIEQAILKAHGQCDDSTDTCKKDKIDEKTALDGKIKCNVTCVSSSSFFSALSFLSAVIIIHVAVGSDR
jgi:hypothetical protein